MTAVAQLFARAVADKWKIRARFLEDHAFVEWVVPGRSALWRFIAHNRGRKYTGAQIREANARNGVGRPIPQQPLAYRVAA